MKLHTERISAVCDDDDDVNAYVYTNALGPHHSDTASYSAIATTPLHATIYSSSVSVLYGRFFNFLLLVIDLTAILSISVISTTEQ